MIGSPIRVLVVDDHEIARKGIRSVLKSNPEIEIVGEVADGQIALKSAETLAPDIVLLDISLPGVSGIDVAKQLKRVCPRCQTIFVTQHDSLAVAKEALKTGAPGYVVKSDAGLELLPAIEAIRNGNTFVSHSLLDRGLELP